MVLENQQSKMLWGIKGVQSKTGKGKSIEIHRERHWSHLELGSTRMVLIFDYILQAHIGGVRAISSLKSPNHQTWDTARPLSRLIGNVYCPYQCYERALEWHQKNLLQICRAKHFRVRQGPCFGLLNQVLDTERSWEPPTGCSSAQPKEGSNVYNVYFCIKISSTSRAMLAVYATQPAKGRSRAINFFWKT